MEGSLNPQVHFQYASALKSGQRVFREHISRGERGYLPALDALTLKTPVMAYMNQSQREILRRYLHRRARQFLRGQFYAFAS
jgi:hypothetical protein